MTSPACRGSKPLRYEQMAVMYDLMSYCWRSRLEDRRIQTTLTNWWLSWRDGPGELVALFLRQESSSIPPPCCCCCSNISRSEAAPAPCTDLARGTPMKHGRLSRMYGLYWTFSIALHDRFHTGRPITLRLMDLSNVSEIRSDQRTPPWASHFASGDPTAVRSCHPCLSKRLGLAFWPAGRSALYS
jgi:hypothetical protein